MSRPTKFTKPQSFFMVPPFPPARAGFVCFDVRLVFARSGRRACDIMGSSCPRFPRTVRMRAVPVQPSPSARRGSALRTRSGQRRRWFLHCSRPPGARANGSGWNPDTASWSSSRRLPEVKSISKIWSSSGSTACMYFRYIFFVSLLFRSDGQKATVQTYCTAAGEKSLLTNG